MEQQHPNCRCEFEDFKVDNNLLVRCEVCFTMDGRTSIGGAHKRAQPGNPVNF